MKKIILWQLFLLAGITLINLNCAHVVDQSVPTNDIPVPSEPTYIDDGVTGGTYNVDTSFTINIPTGSLPPGLRAQPSASQISVDQSRMLSGSEVLISNVYEFNTKAIANFATTQTVEVNLTFDPATVPPAKLNALYIYAKAYHPNNGSVLPIMGTISGSTLTLKLQGVNKKADFYVVYNPNMRGVLSDPPTAGATSIDIYAAATTWPTNRWFLAYDSTDRPLRQAAADGSGGTYTVDTVPDWYLDGVVKNFLTYAVAAGVVYQADGLLPPNLEGKTDQALTGTSESVYLMYTTTGGSYYQASEADENIEFFGYAYGKMYIDPKRYNDHVGYYLGTLQASIAHEMQHAIQQSYTLGTTDNTRGFKEGFATPYGMTIDSYNHILHVRTDGVRETQLLSSYLGCGVNTNLHAFAYANQDFFAYVAKAYNAGSLKYAADLLAQIKLDIEAQLIIGNPDALLAPPLKVLRESLNKVCTAKFSKDLPTIYFDFVKNRAMEHSADSQLRAGEPAAMTLNENLFHSNAITKVSVNPDSLATDSLVGQFSNVAPFSSRAIVFTPSSTKVGGVNTYLTIRPAYGTLGTTAKAVVYRKGVKTELTGPQLISGYGSTADDILTVLLANVDYAQDFNITYRLGPTSSEAQMNTFEAEVTINSVNYPFRPVSIEAAYTYFKQGTSVTYHLPEVAATAATPSSPLGGDTIGLVMNPSKISGTGAVAVYLGTAEKVFTSEANSKAAMLTYFTPLIKNADDNSPVVFEATSGSVIFTNYTDVAGGRLIGSFTANIAGSRETSATGGHRVALTGSITGCFDAELLNQQATPDAMSIFRSD
jgi:hypothetical protein